MTIKNGISASSFLEAVAKCREDVILSTSEGDVLNLKSLLCQYVFAVMASKNDLVAISRITCKNKQDEKFLLEFVNAEYSGHFGGGASHE